MTKVEDLKKQISKIKDANIEVIKAESVFTLLLTGKGLSKWDTVNRINMDVAEFVGDEYPILEVMKNDDGFFLMVLRRNI
jgi:hypothetical protein